MSEDQRTKVEKLLAGEVLQHDDVPLHIEFDAPLTREDEACLRGHKTNQMGMYLFFGIVLAGVPFLASEEELSMLSKILISSAIGVTWYTLVVLVYRKMTRAYKKPKQVIRGFVTAKNIEKTEKSKFYSLRIGKDKDIRVTLSQYNSFEFGDAVEAHLFSAWGSVLLSLKSYDRDELKEALTR